MTSSDYKSSFARNSNRFIGQQTSYDTPTAEDADSSSDSEGEVVSAAVQLPFSISHLLQRDASSSTTTSAGASGQPLMFGVSRFIDNESDAGFSVIRGNWRPSDAFKESLRCPRFSNISHKNKDWLEVVGPSMASTLRCRMLIQCIKSADVMELSAAQKALHLEAIRHGQFVLATSCLPTGTQVKFVMLLNPGRGLDDVIPISHGVHKLEDGASTETILQHCLGVATRVYNGRHTKSEANSGGAEKRGLDAIGSSQSVTRKSSRTVDPSSDQAPQAPADRLMGTIASLAEQKAFHDGTLQRFMQGALLLGISRRLDVTVNLTLTPDSGPSQQLRFNAATPGRPAINLQIHGQRHLYAGHRGWVDVGASGDALFISVGQALRQTGDPLCTSLLPSQPADDASQLRFFLGGYIRQNAAELQPHLPPGMRL